MCDLSTLDYSSKMMHLTPLILAGAFSFFTSIALILLILKRSKTPGLVVERTADLHHQNHTSIPRLGGIGIAAALLGTSVFYLCSDFPADDKSDCRLIVALTMAMFTLGLWDDLRAIGAKRKLLGQILIASAAYWGGISIEKLNIPFLHQEPIPLDIFAWPITVLWLVAITNLINLIDGVDGLAGGICLMLMILLVVVGGGINCVSFLSASMIGALLGFLWFNFPPAKIYLGDGGAYSMGFLIACLTILSSQKGTILAALIAPLFALALPIIDTTLAILRRGLHGLPLFRADRRHIHHRMLAEGISRRRLVLGSYIFTAFFLFLGLAAFWSHGAQLPILFGFGLLFVIIAAGRLRFSREWFSVGRVLGNSLARRTEIQYALAHNRWLIMEGARGQNLDALFDDCAFVARKVGFISLKIRLANVEKCWVACAGDPERCWIFPYHPPGTMDCYIELIAPKNDDPQHAPPKVVCQGERTYRVLAELVTEGWVKAVAEQEKHSGEKPQFATAKAGDRC